MWVKFSRLPYWGKKSREKWLNFSQTKYFPGFLFPDQYFSPIFFHLTKNLSRIFFFNYYYYYYYYCYYYYYYYYYFPIYLQNLLLPCFFDVLYLSLLRKPVSTKILKCEWKQGIEKNINNNDINATKNCTFVNFKSCTTLKTSKKIGFKLVLFISTSKERVFNFFKDFVCFFDRLYYPRWFKSFKTKSLHPRKYSYIS